MRQGLCLSEVRELVKVRVIAGGDGFLGCLEYICCVHVGVLCGCV